MHDLSPPRPDWVDLLLAEVERAFETTGATTPGWPDPHAEREVEEAEYSRCIDPGKYRILDTRVEAWAQALAARGLADADDVPRDEIAWRGAQRPPAEHSRVRRITPRTPGGAGLLLATTVVDGDPFGLDIVITAPTAPSVLVASEPDCGCDACDDGSEPLLEALDGWFVTVIRGGVLQVSHNGTDVTRTWNGWQATGYGPSETWLDPRWEAPRGAQRWVGAAWGPPPLSAR